MHYQVYEWERNAAGMGNNYDWTFWVRFSDGAVDKITVGPSASEGFARHQLEERIRSDDYVKPAPPEKEMRPNDVPEPREMPDDVRGGGGGGGGRPQDPLAKID